VQKQEGIMTTASLRAPIVLVHGLLGFDRLRVVGITVASYFADIPDVLTKAGNRVYVAQLSPTGGIKQRAEELRRFIQEGMPSEPMHIFAHSMGGLDSRYMIACLGMEGRVLSLTTLGTPHRGTTFADWGVKRFNRFLKPLLSRLAIPHQAFYDLTTQACSEFNASVHDVPSVRYFSVAGRHDPGWLNPVWQLPQSVLSGVEGPNDGVVSIASANYGENCSVWEGDHLSLINWVTFSGGPLGRFRHRGEQYLELVQQLAKEGY
jgi:triacylglycerol lipase